MFKHVVNNLFCPYSKGGSSYKMFFNRGIQGYRFMAPSVA